VLCSQKVNAYISSCTTISGPILKSSLPAGSRIVQAFSAYKPFSCIIPKTQKGINVKELKFTMFGKTKCKLCGDEVRFALKHLRGKHRDVYSREVVSKIKTSDVMKKYFFDF
jgi:hypothetical protein